MTFNPRAIAITVVVVGALLAYALGRDRNLWSRDVALSGAQTSPLRTDEQGLEAMRATVGGELFALERNDMSIRVLAWEETPGNHACIAYRRRGELFERFGSTLFPTGFDRPRLAGSPARLEMRERRTGAVFVLRVEGDDIALVPSDDQPEGFEIHPVRQL